MNITIIGGGNIGTLIAAQLIAKNHNVTIYTRDTSKWSDSITVCDKDIDKTFTVKISNITDNLSQAIKTADLIISTIPPFAIRKIIKTIENDINPNAILGFIPGYGGMEFLCQNLIKNGNTIFATQRVCSVARLKEYGKTVITAGKRKEMYISALPKSQTELVRKIFEELFDVTTISLPNYLNVTLTPTNPILHTSRLYVLFKDYKQGVKYKNNKLFYEEWDENSSRMLINCDRELHNILSKIDINTDMIIPLLQHYESVDVYTLTQKIKSIKSLQGIYTPMIHTETGYIPDFDSRYFKSDFPYGLLIVKSFALIANVKTPNIDKILKWYQNIIGKEYLNEKNELGSDSTDLSLPQNYNIATLKKIKEFYS